MKQEQEIRSADGEAGLNQVTEGDNLFIAQHTRGACFIIHNSSSGQVSLSHIKVRHMKVDGRASELWDHQRSMTPWSQSGTSAPPAMGRPTSSKQRKHTRGACFFIHDSSSSQVSFLIRHDDDVLNFVPIFHGT
jgi:hypothetical protein